MRLKSFQLVVSNAIFLQTLRFGRDHHTHVSLHWRVIDAGAPIARECSMYNSRVLVAVVLLVAACMPLNHASFSTGFPMGSSPLPPSERGSIRSLNTNDLPSASELLSKYFNQHSTVNVCLTRYRFLFRLVGFFLLVC